MKPTFGSLFSGIGGIDLGLEQAGWECRWQVEKDRFCTSVLKKHWPKVPKFGDVKLIAGSELEPVELICGGFPCQPISIAGKRKAQEDERWLWPEFARIISILRPNYILVENVPNLTNLGINEVLGSLASLRYDAEWDCIPAASLGAPHLRFRIFIVAYNANTDGFTGPDEQKLTIQGRTASYSNRTGDMGYREDKGKHSSLSNTDSRILRVGRNGKRKQYKHQGSTLPMDNGHKEHVANSEVAHSDSYGQQDPSNSNQDKGMAARPRLSSQQSSTMANLRSRKQEQDSTLSQWFSEIVPDASWERKGSRLNRRILGLANDGVFGGRRAVNSYRAHADVSRKWWAVEPDVGRVAHGVPSRVDRLRSLGNAVVPQVAEWIGKRLIEQEFST